MIHKPAYLVHTKFPALLLNHYTTVFCMSSCDENVQPLRAFFNGLKMWKSHGDMEGVWHCPQHARRRFLNSVGHTEAGTVGQQGDAFNVFTYKRSRSNTMWFSHIRTFKKAPKFTSGDDVQETATQWFPQPPMEFFAHEILPTCTPMGLLSKCLLWLFVTQYLYSWAPSKGFLLYIPHTHLETMYMRRCIQTEALQPKTKLYLLRRKVNKKRRVNFTCTKSLHFYN